MAKRLTALVMMTFALLVGSVRSADALPITVNIYSGFTLAGGGAPYSGLVGTFGDTDIQFATETGYAWHPFALGGFGADIFGTLNVAAAGNYTFSLNSDDGSLLFIDSAQVINNGGAHGPLLVSGTVFLTAGLHPFEVQFFECCSGASGVDLNIPTGVTYADTNAVIPEPTSLLLLGTGLVGAARRWRTRRA